MDIRIRETGEVVQDYGFRSLHENTSFPAVLTDELLAEFGADFIYPGIAPQPLRYQTVYSDGVEQIEGKWYTKYSVADMDQDGKDALDAQKATSQRERRNTLLSECDWTQVLDAPVDQTTWATYRQQLRDITTQAGFPWDVQWPSKPE